MPKEYGTPGPRSIYPEMCDSRSLSRCSVLAVALFPRLIVQADDQGRLHGDATDVRGVCFPKMPKVTVKAVESALVELESVEAILRYVVAAEPYVQVKEWWSYQSYQRRSYASRHPAPEGWTDRVYGLHKDGRTDDGQGREGDGQRPRQLEPPRPAAASRAGAVPSRPVPSVPIHSGPVPSSGADGGLKTTEPRSHGLQASLEAIDPTLAVLRSAKPGRPHRAN